jgi:anti-sigma B factor antagonist
MDGWATHLDLGTRAMTTAQARSEQVPEALHVDVAHRGRRTLVTVRGELDLATARKLERVLAAQARHDGPFVLDLRGLSFIDASGLGVLLRANADARHRRTELQLSPGDAVIRLLELCRIRAHFSYTDPPPD